jgi:hypothetical protein
LRPKLLGIVFDASIVPIEHFNSTGTLNRTDVFADDADG